MPGSKVYAVILAGGSGTRFWPLSRELSPKQMLSVFGKTSLICGTIERARLVASEAPPQIVVGATLHDEIRNHLLACPQMKGVALDYLVEPVARNTAPALALAAACVEASDPEAVVMMLPSDQLVDSGEPWRATMRAAVEAATTRDVLVTIGLVPTRPETGYGYIKAAEGGTGVGALPVEAFVEKPDHKTAQRYVAAGNYYWNSGMLVAKARVILAELEAAQATGAEAAAGNGRIVEVARQIAALPVAERLSPASYQLFETLPKVSFDNAVLELSKHVEVVPTTMDWSDVGSLLSLEDLARPDPAGNRVIGSGVAVDSRGTLIYSPERLVATLGVEDLLVVDTSDATLVAPRERAQDVRLVTDALAKREAPELREPKVSARPWGTWMIAKEGTGFKVKEIVVTPGSRLSLQSHEHRSEHWVVVEGTAVVTQGDKVIKVHTGESVYNPIGMLHRLENRGPGDLHIIEIQVGDYLGEDDITRYDDDFRRD
ncbi:MAG: mannose-1-phosphate guanylyltransferase/mannose-6-phosphate isomerase [Actinomycetia bacterium]|nr:mannose-1-phosphate guanylyltransferase/mannose-6-phosphate isomerase [Actinomycetes bacterium]